MSEIVLYPDQGAVTLSVSDGVALVTLNRPEKRNVFSGGMQDLLSAAYARCDADDDIRVVVLTGAGSAFCAGADMNPEANTFGAVGKGFSAQPLNPPAWAVRKPVIAAINGHAIGIGFSIAMQCDIRYVAKDAKLAIPQARRGVMGDGGSHWTITRAASRAVAADILLTGRTFLGSEAVQLGIASIAFDTGEAVLANAMEVAKDMALNCAPVSMAMSKRLLWADAPLTEVCDLETAFHRVVMGGPDAREGPSAWFERRAPKWSMRISEEWPRVLDQERSVKKD